MTNRTAARTIFLEALRQIDVASAVDREIHCTPTHLTILGQTHHLTSAQTILIVAVGKAASAMYQAAAAALPHIHTEALVIAPAAPAPAPNLAFHPGGHPTPDANSRAAANAVLARLHQVDASTIVLFLLSGGASSMLELPLNPAITLAETAAFHRALVASGLPIAQMNALRKRFSAVKGGRLAAAAQRAAAQYTLVVSDVPAAALDCVGSGPSLPDTSAHKECLHLFRTLAAGTTLPPSIVAWFEDPNLPAPPAPNDPAFARARWQAILSSDHLLAAASIAASSLGFHVEIDNSCDDWPFAQAARHLLLRATELSHLHPRLCLLSAGEVSVPLTNLSGSGGRNQHFALYCALQLARTHAPITVLSAGSDGIDGNSPAAGAIADSATCSRALAVGLDPEHSLAAFDSFPFFQSLGDAILTGPTGNNLRDLRILLIGNPSSQDSSSAEGSALSGAEGPGTSRQFSRAPKARHIRESNTTEPALPLGNPS